VSFTVLAPNKESEDPGRDSRNQASTDRRPRKRLRERREADHGHCSKHTYHDRADKDDQRPADGVMSP
jgi:hypothetical protein